MRSQGAETIHNVGIEIEQWTKLAHIEWQACPQPSNCSWEKGHEVPVVTPISWRNSTCSPDVLTHDSSQRTGQFRRALRCSGSGRRVTSAKVSGNTTSFDLFETLLSGTCGWEFSGCLSHKAVFTDGPSWSNWTIHTDDAILLIYWIDVSNLYLCPKELQPLNGWTSTEGLLRPSPIQCCPPKPPGRSHSASESKACHHSAQPVKMTPSGDHVAVLQKWFSGWIGEHDSMQGISGASCTRPNVFSCWLNRWRQWRQSIRNRFLGSSWSSPPKWEQTCPNTECQFWTIGTCSPLPISQCAGALLWDTFTCLRSPASQCLGYFLSTPQHEV